MADWKQITARIRRARTGKDPAGQLSNLFEKTRDAMVAFELGKYFEAAGDPPQAARWYASAAERFRRSDWKTKAQEAVTRLGGVPDSPAASLEGAESSNASALDFPQAAAPAAGLGFDSQSRSSAELPPPPVGAPLETAIDSDAPPSDSESAPGQKRRRRGRRGGRNRRKPAGRSASPASASSEASSPPSLADRHSEPRPPRVVDDRSFPRLPVEPVSEIGAPSLRGRSGDPGLSSRLSLLEMQLRRLLTCAPVKISEAGQAPVGPGVLVLTDSDLTSYYYVEACQTLRIAISNLASGRRGGESIKPRLAAHLGIPEARVSKYLADHCVVRWLQLDEGASHFAHFVIAVIRPSLNE